MLRFSIGLGLLVLISTGVWVAGMNGGDFFILLVVLWPMFALFTPVALIYALVGWRKHGKRAALPLLVQIGTFVLTYGMVAGMQSIDLDFRLRQAGFNEVVALVETGQIQPDPETDTAILPAQYRHLSDGGTILIEKENDHLTVLFYRSSGILGEFSGYAYRSDNTPLSDFVWCDLWGPLHQPVPNWFTCDSP